jgi:hypothetical protein
MPPPPQSPSASPDRPANEFSHLLDRPADQRRREYQYRFGQAVVFGLPVLGLEWFGRSLGGPESDRWVAILQALLTGWIVYVAAAGMLFEGLVWLARRRLAADLVPSALSVGLYLASLARLAAYALRGAAGPFPRTWFHWVVVVLIAWSGLRWWQFVRRTAGRTT